jgi:tetratricopeptide (TPR) repeat protein
MAQAKFAEAAAVYQRALQAKPDSPEVHYHLGRALEKQGDLAAAVEHYRVAVCLQPDSAKLLNRLGVIQRQQGQLEAAVASLQQALRVKPDSPEAHYNLGNVLHDLGRLTEAMQHYREALRLRPDFPEAYANLGVTFGDRGEFGIAVQHYQEALRLKSDFPEAHYNLGNALQELGYLEAAVEHYRAALRLRPNFPEGHNNLANVLQTQGKFDEAKASYQQALRLRADFQEARAGLARVLEKEGSFEQAYEHLKPLVEAGSTNPAVLITFALLCRHFDRRTEARTLLERRLTQGSIPLGQRRVLLFMLGTLCDELGAFDQAFMYYQQANILKPRRFDPSQHAAFIEALIATCNADFLARMPRATQQSERPIFIVGMPRSGTSLVEQILASHPAVYGAGELEDINQIANSLADTLGTDRPYPYSLKMLSQETLNSTAQRYLDRLAMLSDDALRVTDKMPGNFVHLGLIALLFPRARIIHCVRDPLDTCLSCYFQDFVNLHPYAYDLTHLGAYYRQYQRLMRHWEEVLDLPMLKVQYEELVAHQEPLSRQIVAFCGLEWHEQCLRFHETKRVVRTASYDQVRRPMYTTSIGRHRHYARYLGPLKAALAREG